MKSSSLLALLFVCAGMFSACQNPGLRPRSAGDDRPYNPQSQRFESRSQASGTEAPRQVKDRPAN